MSYINFLKLRISPDSIDTGAWVRYLIGEENKQPVYRICEVVGRLQCLPTRMCLFSVRGRT